MKPVVFPTRRHGPVLTFALDKYETASKYARRAYDFFATGSVQALAVAVALVGLAMWVGQ